MDEVRTIEESEIWEINDTSSELEKMDVENKVKKKKERKKKTVQEDVEIIEVIDTEEEIKKYEGKKEKMKEIVTVENNNDGNENNEEQNSDNNFTAKKEKNENEKEKQNNPEIKLDEKEEEIEPNEKRKKKEKDDKENVKKMEEQSTTNTDEGNIIVLKKEQGNKENAKNEKNNENSRKRKREPKDNEKTSKKDQALRDQSTLFIRFPESFVVKKQSHLNDVRELAAATIRFPNVPQGSRKGFCYAEYKTEEEAKRVKEVMEKKLVNGECFQVEFLTSLSKIQQSQLSNTVDPLSLFVGRLPKWIKEDTVRAFFPTAINIKCSKGMRVSHRNAIVTFKTEEEAKRVVNASKGLKIGKSEVTIMFVNKRHKYKKKEKEDNDVLPKPPKRLKKEDVAIEINITE